MILPTGKEMIMDDLVPRSYYYLAVANKQTRKRLRSIEQEGMVRRAAIDSAARDAALELEAREQMARSQALMRVKGTYDLSEYATHRATQLNDSIRWQSRSNPRLEQIHRSFEDTAAVTAQRIIYRFGTAE